MNKNLLKLIVACGTACFLACAAPQKTETEKWSERMARSEMKRFPEPWMIEKAKKPRWGYTHGLVVKSMLEEWAEHYPIDKALNKIDPITLKDKIIEKSKRFLFKIGITMFILFHRINFQIWRSYIFCLLQI